MNALISFIKPRKGLAGLAFIFLLFLAENTASQNSILTVYPGFDREVDLNSIASSNFLKDSTYVFKKNSGTWILNSRAVFNYDVQGNEISLIESGLVDDLWIAKKKIEKAYDSAQNLTYQRTSEWSNEQLDWLFSERKDFEYNTVDILEREINWVRIEDLWKKNQKVEYSYFESYLLESISEFDWEEEIEGWVPTERTLFEYSADEVLNREVLQVWVDSLDSWLNFTARDYSYDENNQLISTTRSSWSPAEQGWVNISMISLFYNDKGQIQSTRQIDLSPSNDDNLVSQDVSYDDQGNPGETITSNWNPEEGEWESITKRVHFWSENITGNLDSRSTNIDCAFMNPYILGLTWNCSSLKDNVLYSVEVRDLMGRKFFQDQFLGNRAFRIDGAIPPGVYLVIIRGGIDVYTEKVIIKG